jgi:hypothetical protein
MQHSAVLRPPRYVAVAMAQDRRLQIGIYVQACKFGERFLSLTDYWTPSKMPNLKSYLWWAMPPTAFLSLASLLTYLVFRIVYLATAEQVERRHSEDATFNRLRTLALPWIFFVLEMIILRKLPSNSISLSIDGCKTLTRSSARSTKCHPILHPDSCYQARSTRETILGW